MIFGVAWCCCDPREDGEIAMPEFGAGLRPPKAPLSHISEERSSQMAGSSMGTNSRGYPRRSRSNTDTYSSAGTRRTSLEARLSNSFEDTRPLAQQQFISQITNLSPYVINETDNEGSETSNLTPLPTQMQMTARRRQLAPMNVLGTIPDSETPRGNRSSCTMESLSARSESDEIDRDEFELSRMTDYLNAQLASSPPRGMPPESPKIDISGSTLEF